MIFVTGATGLLGSHLTAALLLGGKKVRAVYRDKRRTETVRQVLSYYTAEAEKYFDRIEWVEGDITDVYSLQPAFAGVSEVYHCAGYVSFNDKNTKQLYRINADGTANMVNLALENKVGKFCHVSSVATLQVEANKKYIDELSVWKTSSGNSSYAITKFRGEFEAWRGAAEGLNVVVVNPSLILGAGCWNQSSSELVTQVYKGLPVYTSGITGYVDVRDVVNCMLRLVDENKFGQRYIINSENLSMKEVTQHMQRFLHRKESRIEAGPFLLQAGRLADSIKSVFTGKAPTVTKNIVRSALAKNYYDNSKVVKELGYTFIPVKESLAYISQKFLLEHVS